MLRFCCFKLSTIAFLVGWIGLIWSIGTLLAISIFYSDEYAGQTRLQSTPDSNTDDLESILSCKHIQKSFQVLFVFYSYFALINYLLFHSFTVLLHSQKCHCGQYNKFVYLTVSDHRNCQGIYILYKLSHMIDESFFVFYV